MFVIKQTKFFINRLKFQKTTATALLHYDILTSDLWGVLTLLQVPDPNQVQNPNQRLPQHEIGK